MLVRPTCCRCLLLHLLNPLISRFACGIVGHEPQSPVSEIVGVLLTSNVMIASMNVI